MPFIFSNIAIGSRVALTLILSLSALNCQAWGTQGHQITASLATT